MTNDDLLCGFHMIGPIESVHQFFEFNTMQPTWKTQVGSRDTKTDAWDITNAKGPEDP
ncbi:MAG: hypothetical protein VXZ38_05145 [Planctomycetota bacterium]|nr:hypothetical protein [Planctomycetota bacterium]